MAEKLRDYPILNFNGGLVKNRSDYEMDKNQFSQTLNLEFDEVGRASRRRGIVQVGDVVTGKILDDSASFESQTLGQNVLNTHIIVSREENGVIYRVYETYTTGAVATTDTTINIASFPNISGVGSNAEIGGDIIAFTGNTATSLTGCSGILKAIPAFTQVRFIIAWNGAVNVDTRSGVYFAYLNNKLIINGRAGSAYSDGSTPLSVTDDDEPAGLFATTYRQRVYVAGSGVVNGAGTRNGSAKRVSFSDAGDATSWTLTNYFDVEDQRGEDITGLKVNGDYLLVFKTNAFFSYDEVNLRQRDYTVGAYNHKVIRNIGNLTYTFCPSGVFATNGFSSQKISKPVDKYLKKFKPKYDTLLGRVVNNCFAGTYQEKYLLHIGNITDPDDSTKTITGCTLVYDTKNNNWTVFDSLTNFTHFGSFFSCYTGNQYNSTVGNRISQTGEVLFAGDSGGKYWRLFEDSFMDNAATQVQHGGDIIPNLVSNSNGDAISTVLESAWIDFGNHGSWKKIEYIRVLIEQGEFDLSYKLDRGTGHITDWIPLGNFKDTNTKVPLKDKEGYRIKVRLTSNTKDVISILNGLVLEDIYAIPR